MADSFSHAVFIDRAYEEARDLLVATRDYVAGPSNEEGKRLAAPDRLRLTLELARLTRRLTEATAWLMLQKGVAAGEMTAVQAATASAAEFDGGPEADADAMALARLPVTARSLIDRSRRLHAHVAQLRDSMSAAGS